MRLIKYSDSLLGTCRQLSVGPEAALSLIIGEAITKFIAEEVHAHGEISDHEKMKLAAIISTGSFVQITSDPLAYA